MRYLFLFFILLGFQRTIAQKLNGEILDKLSGEPISFVLITTEKSETSSDDNGLFSIEIEEVSSIIFSKSGYEETI